jgi:hypothetical protein
MRHCAQAALGTAVVALAAAFFLGFPVWATATCPLAPQANPAVSFSPILTHIRPGQVCTLQVFVDDAVDSLSCMEIGASYDTAYATCTTAIEGTLYTQAPFPRFYRWEKLGADTVSAVDCVLGYRSYILPPGQLVCFVFKGLKYGVCHVYFQKVRLFDIDRVELQTIKGEHAEIVVSAQSGDVPLDVRGASLDSYPNPFNPSTVIVLQLPGEPGGAKTPVSLDIYSASGARVRSLLDQSMPPGRYKTSWDGRGEDGRFAATGVYFVVARTSVGVVTHKMVMIR